MQVRPGKRYFIYFIHHLLDFQRAEINALAGMMGITEQQLNWEVVADPDAGTWLPSCHRRCCRRPLPAPPHPTPHHRLPA
jgi:hypothetical protein